MSTQHPHPADDPEAAALEEEITRGARREAPAGAGSTAAPRGTGPEGVRTGTLAWGVIALLVALWSLATTVLDWDVDPVLVAIGLAALAGVVLVAGGIAGATRKGH